MTPQSNFMVLAPILPERETELRQLLDSVNHGPGQVDPNNALLPFVEFEALHFARFVILDDKTTEDIRVYGLTPRTYPLYLAFLGDVDGDANAFLGKLIKRAGKGLGKIFSCCQGFAPDTDLLDWMKQHDAPAIAAYVNWRGEQCARFAKRPRFTMRLRIISTETMQLCTACDRASFMRNCGPSSTRSSRKDAQRYRKKVQHRSDGRSKICCT